MNTDNPLKTAIDKAGGVTQLVAAVNAVIKDGVKPLSSQRVCNWGRRGTSIAAEYVPAISQITGLSKHDLRPDVFDVGS